MVTRKRSIGAALLTALALTITPASAQDGKWRTYYASATQAFKAGRYGDAIRLLEDAHRLSGQDALLYNIAKAAHFKFIDEKKEEDLLHAVKTYRAYLEKVPQGSRRHEATQALSELEPQLPKPVQPEPGTDPAVVDPENPYPPEPAEPQPPKPTPAVEAAPRTGVVVTTGAEGAIIVLDGAVQSSSPLVALTLPGMHTIRVEAPGFVTVERRVRVDAGVELALDLPLVVQPASVDVGGPDGASVFLDGKHVGDLPLGGPLSVEPGDHFLAVTQNGRLAFTESLLLGRGEGRFVAADLDVTSQRYAAYATFAAGSAGLVVGAILAGVTVHHQNNAEELEDQRLSSGGQSEDAANRFDDSVSKRDDFRAATLTAFGLSAALLTTGVFLYVFDEPVVSTPPRRERGPDVPTPAGPGLEIGAAPTPEGGTVTLRLRF